MSTVKTIAKNTTLLIAAQLSSLVMSFFFLGLSARYLGPVSFGILSFALAFTNVFSIFTDVGLRQYMTREVAKDLGLARKYLGNVMGIKLALVGVTALALVAALALMGFGSPDREVIYIVALAMFLNAFIQTFYALFQAYERMEYLSAGTVMESAMMLGFALAAIYLDIGIVQFSLIYLAARAVILLFCVAASAAKFIVPTVAVDRVFWKEMLSKAWPFGLAGLFISVYCWIDTIMIAFYWDSEAVGFYNAAYRLFAVASFIPSNLMAALFPIMARSFGSSNDNLKKIYQLSLKYMLLLGIPLSAGTMLLSGEIIGLLYGAEYEPSVFALQILIWQTIFSFVNYSLAYLLNSIDQQRNVTVCVGVGMALNIALNIIVIPIYGFVGAAATTVVTEIVVVAILFGYASKTTYHLGARPMGAVVARATLSALAMAAVVMIMLWWNIHLFVIIGAAIPTYVAMSYLVGAIDKADIAIMRQIIHKS